MSGGNESLRHRIIEALAAAVDMDEAAGKDVRLPRFFLEELAQAFDLVASRPAAPARRKPLFRPDKLGRADFNPNINRGRV